MKSNLSVNNLPTIGTGISCSLFALMIPIIHNTKTTRFTKLKILAKVGTTIAMILKATEITIPKIAIPNPCFKWNLVRESFTVNLLSVSYTHLTLPTIYSV